MGNFFESARALNLLSLATKRFLLLIIIIENQWWWQGPQRDAQCKLFILPMQAMRHAYTRLGSRNWFL
jgi:hypothetical protein